MTRSPNHLKALRDAIILLAPSGEAGFEGLVGSALHGITGRPFRIAGSGRQFGSDGRPLFDDSDIRFEAKRYHGSIQRDSVMARVADLIADEAGPDLWVLAATSPVPAQLADDVRRLARKGGISVLVLDWSERHFPPLAMALAMGGTQVELFIDRLLSGAAKRAVRSALQAIRIQEGYDAQAAVLKRHLEGMTDDVGQSNARWLTAMFSDKAMARVQFGQPLAPRDERVSRTLPRNEITNELQAVTRSCRDDVIVVLGKEGCGKSWIVAQSWLSTTVQPLMIVVRSDELADRSFDTIHEFLIGKLAQQTDHTESANASGRWRRRFALWRETSAAETVRIIVLIDGLNQKPQLDWGRLIDRIWNEVRAMGGLVVVTTRTSFFRQIVQPRLTAPVYEVLVPEWTAQERDQLLSNQNFDCSSLQEDVAKLLRNPRLLGITLDLAQRGTIVSLNELSVSRLLFEHIHASVRDGLTAGSVTDFVRLLQQHAEVMLSRIRQNRQEDLKIFESDASAVAHGRFFHSVSGDPTRYDLRGEGLTLALGFCVVQQLHTAQRNNRLEGAVALILEPVAALDDTADVVSAAITILALDDERYDQQVLDALLCGFADLQNAAREGLVAFASLAKRRPLAFMDAARRLCLLGGRQANFDWIRTAIVTAAEDQATWSMLAPILDRWLSVYSLAVDLGLPAARHTDKEFVESQRDGRRTRIAERLASLAPQEHAFLGEMDKSEGSTGTLARLAIHLLAGRRLAPFAQSILRWSLSQAINSDHGPSYDDMLHLVSLNRIDWRETREQLLRVSQSLRHPTTSRTGQWALVTILRATGASTDASEARRIVEDLTKDEERFDGWRLVEQYSDTDPCDPLSTMPTNLSPTSAQYRALDVEMLAMQLGRTSEDHFFEMARPALARFDPDCAIDKHRELTDHIVRRCGYSLRQGLLELREHNALVTVPQAATLAALWRNRIDGTWRTDLSDRDLWVVTQYFLLLALPLIDAREQVDLLLLTADQEHVLLELLDELKPLDEATVESLLLQAKSAGDEHRQYLLLHVVGATRSALSSTTRSYVASLVNASSPQLRQQALAIIADSEDSAMLTNVGLSSWHADATPQEAELERWYGSIALMKAAARGLVDHREAIGRMTPAAYGRAALAVGDEGRREIARRLDKCIDNLVGLKNTMAAPDIEMSVDRDLPDDIPMFRMAERPPSDLRTALDRMSEPPDAFEERQRLTRVAFQRFKETLTSASAQLVLDNLGLEEFAAIVAAEPSLAERWYRLFIACTNSQLPFVHNLILWLAHALGRNDSTKAQRLLSRIETVEPFVHVRYSPSGVSLRSLAIWLGERNSILDGIRYSQLDDAQNDQELAAETLAALIAGKQGILEEYVNDKLRHDEPSEIARGLMVAGLGDRSEFNSHTLVRYGSTVGLIREAHYAAQFAYDRNCWARHWYEEMCRAESPEQFWRFGMLFRKIVDPRFEVWKEDYVQGKACSRFVLSITGRLSNRYDRWERKRRDKLFGQKAPDPVFLSRKRS